MKYMTPKEAAAKWGLSQRRVHVLCAEGRIKGVERHGGIWLIPETAEKPGDARVKSGRYIKTKSQVPAAATETAAAAVSKTQPEAEECPFLVKAFA